MGVSQDYYRRMTCNENKEQLNSINEQIDHLYEVMAEEASKYGSFTESTFASYQSLMDSKDKIEQSIIIDESIISKMVEKHKDHKKAESDFEASFDKKYNAFCLTVSNYDVNKLEATMEKKKNALKAVKDKMHKAKGEDKKHLAAEAKYLTKICNKCGADIRRKKKYA